MTIVEQWKPVVGYEGLYEVSNLGQVQSLDRTCHDKNGLAKKFKGKVLANIKKINTYGEYYIIRLPRKTGGHMNAYVAHLVLEAFVGPRPIKAECCHCDGNSLNNNADNLRWGSPKENSRDKYEHGTVLWGSKNHQAKLTEEQVIEIRKKYVCNSKYKTNSKELAAEYGVDSQTIGKIVRRERWQHLP